MCFIQTWICIFLFVIFGVILSVVVNVSNHQPKKISQKEDLYFDSSDAGLVFDSVNPDPNFLAVNQRYDAIGKTKTC